MFICIIVYSQSGIYAIFSLLSLHEFLTSCNLTFGVYGQCHTRECNNFVIMVDLLILMCLRNTYQTIIEDVNFDSVIRTWMVIRVYTVELSIRNL